MKKIENSHNENEETHSSRRGFLKKSAIVTAPIVVSVFSSPVLAAKCSLSGMESGNLSREQDVICVTGLSPGYWKTHTSWPFPLGSGESSDLLEVSSLTVADSFGASGTMFHDFLHGFAGSKYPDHSMMQVMQEFNSNGNPNANANAKIKDEDSAVVDSGGPEFHVIAALLNAYEYPGQYFLTVQNVHQLYSQYLSGEITSSYLRTFLNGTWK